jgi:hypothetical protein
MLQDSMRERICCCLQLAKPPRHATLHVQPAAYKDTHLHDVQLRHLQARKVTVCRTHRLVLDDREASSMLGYRHPVVSHAGRRK